MVYSHIDSPIGPLLLAGDASGLRRIAFARSGRAVPPEPDWGPDYSGKLGEAQKQLEEYFAGKRREFALVLAPEGTAFQRRVWEVLLAIPYGQTVSYGWAARAVGNPRASRAVGAAAGRNPLPIVVPCHRVVGADRRLTGFTGGLAIKRALLAIEGALPPEEEEDLFAATASGRPESFAPERRPQ